MITVTSSSTELECNRIYMQARREADDRKAALLFWRIAIRSFILIGVLAAFALGVALMVVR